MFNFFKTVIREALHEHIEPLSCHSVDKMIEFSLWSRSQLPEESLTTTYPLDILLMSCPVKEHLADHQQDS